jgi:outer membrane protein assembly factor BamC
MLSSELLRRVSRAAIIAAVGAAFLAGCETTTSLGKKIDYKSAGSVPALEVPPDLTTPTYDDRYQVTTASGVAAARAVGRTSEVLPVSADARLARSGSQRWLVVKATQDEAWTILRDFWTKNGFGGPSSPTLGIMETGWAENRADVPKDFLQKFTSIHKLRQRYLQARKFRSRIERGTGRAEICQPSRRRRPARLRGSPEDWNWRLLPRIRGGV